MMTDDEIIAVVQAHKEGKDIEHKLRDHDGLKGVWCPLTHSSEWGYFATRDYRVKPKPYKPREWKVWVGESGLWFDKFFDLHRCPDKPFIRVREVID